MKKKILLFSTLSPHPFWAGSEKFWFDFVTDARVSSVFDFHLHLADSPVTRKMATIGAASGATASFYKHFNVDFARRNISRLRDRLSRRAFRTLPWYDEIRSGKYDLVWFNLDGLHNLLDLEYASVICRERSIPYWIILQHGYEDFFLADEREIEAVAELSAAARRFIFIAKRNRRSLERAIGRRLHNAFHSANALSNRKITEANVIASASPPGVSETAKFFNLGRFSPKDKGQHLLLEAFADPKWKDRNWSLSFIGVSDAGRLYLKRLIAFFELDAGKMEIVPFTDDVFTEIAKNDVLLMPSLAEGTPYAMIESMACGRPAMGTSVGGIPELITDGENGWLARTTDVCDIADALEDVWNDRKRWAEFGKKAATRIKEEFSEDRTHDDLMKAIAEDLP